MKEWTTCDKTKWPEHGPWTNEPDKVQWVDPLTNLDCLAVRASSHWCGYVGVPEGHPLFKRSYSACLAHPQCGDDDGYCYDHTPQAKLEVHGGITFSGACQPLKDPAEGICHVPEPGRPEVWWFGFDCAHCDDYRPSTSFESYEIALKYPLAHQGEYRDLSYVQEEVRSLAKQLKDFKL